MTNGEPYIENSGRCLGLMFFFGLDASWDPPEFNSPVVPLRISAQQQRHTFSDRSIFEARRPRQADDKGLVLVNSELDLVDRRCRVAFRAGGTHLKIQFQFPGPDSRCLALLVLTTKDQMRNMQRKWEESGASVGREQVYDNDENATSASRCCRHWSEFLIFEVRLKREMCYHQTIGLE